MEQSEEHTSSLLAQLQAVGFQARFEASYWEEEQSGFYSVLAAALSLHVNRNYGETSDILTHLWSERLPSFYKAAGSWDSAILGNALRSDLHQHFQHCPWASLICQGKVPSSTSAKIWTLLADYCAFQLIWYEVTSAGIITHMYATASADTWRVFVTLAEERSRLYLIVHKDCEDTPRLGFPFYSLRSESANIPILGVENDAIDRTKELSYEALSRYQGDIINTLLQVISRIDTLPAHSKSTKNQIRVLYQRIQTAPNYIDAQALQSFLGLSERVDSSQQLPTNACICCRRSWSASLLCRFEHGHALCVNCCFVHKNIKACFCQAEISQRDMREIQQYATISLR